MSESIGDPRSDLHRMNSGTIAPSRAPAEAPPTIASDFVRAITDEALWEIGTIDWSTLGDREMVRVLREKLLRLAETYTATPAEAPPTLTARQHNDLVELCAEAVQIWKESSGLDRPAMYIADHLNSAMRAKGFSAAPPSTGPSPEALRPGQACPEHGEPLLLLCAKCKVGLNSRTERMDLHDELDRRFPLIVDFKAFVQAGPSPTAALREALETVLAWANRERVPPSWYDMVRAALAGGDRG